MAKRIPLTIITPERVTWEGEVDSLVAPAFDGQLGVLPGHAPLLAQLVPGVVRIRSGEETRDLAVSGGYLEVNRGRAALFAETAELAEEIDAERARQAVEKARAALHGPREAMAPEEALAALRRALVRLKVAEQVRRRPAASAPHVTGG